MAGTIHEIQKAGEWLRNYPAEFKVVIAGNHDFGFEKDTVYADICLRHGILGDEDKSIIYLQDSPVMLNGVKFYGSPFTPWFYDWAFNAWRGPEIKKHWDKIPDDTDVLITHGPAYGICDKVSGNSLGLDEVYGKGHAGCVDLLNRIKEVNPKIHVSGHLHQGRGHVRRGQTDFYNATVVNEKYNVVYNPFEVEI
jgi:Icc-related predicted phosphoesterase